MVPGSPVTLQWNTLNSLVEGGIDDIWRRLTVIPFNAKITGKSDIKNYADYLFGHAGPAVMSWIIEDAKKAIDKDFHTDLPDVVEAAIKVYREAKQNPADEITFKWLRMNMWVSSTTS